MMAFPDRLVDIIDPVLLSTVETCSRKPQHESLGLGETDNAISSVTRLALSCSKLTPSERISMRDAADELRKPRDRYLTDLSRADNL